MIAYALNNCHPIEFILEKHCVNFFFIKQLFNCYLTVILLLLTMFDILASHKHYTCSFHEEPFTDLLP